MAKLDIEKKIEIKNENISDKEMEKVKYVNDRFHNMDNERSKYERDWDIYDAQVQSYVPESFDGKANVNMPLEQSMIEMRTGLIPDKLPFKVVPNGAVDVNILEPAKYVMDDFIHRERVWEEINDFDYDKAKYGT